jgi:predicted small metal-binding protein
MTADAIRRLRCACGWETMGTLDEVIAATEEHGRRVHNMHATRDEIVAMLLPLEADHRAQPDDHAAPRA